MGKARKRNQTNHRHNPTGLSCGADSELTCGSDKSKSESVIQSVREKLLSQTSEDKVCGLQLLGNLYDEKSFSEVAKSKLIRIAGPLFVDPDPSVRNSAVCAVRNLTDNGGPRLCNLLVEQDVMTPLCALLDKFGNSWLPKNPDKPERDEEVGTFTQAVTILWTLCESNSTALHYFNQSNLVPSLVRCFDIETFGVEVALAVAQCLHIVTEDNKDLAPDVQNIEDSLLQILNRESNDFDYLLLRVRVAGILLNLKDKVSALSPSTLSLIMLVLSAVLTCDHRKVLNDLTSNLDLPTKKKSQNVEKAAVGVDENGEEVEMSEETTEKTGKTNSGKEKDDSKLIIQAIHLLEAQIAALETLTNLCSGDDDDDTAMDVESSDSDEQSDTSIGNESGSQIRIPVTISSDVSEAIISQKLFAKVWDKTVLPAHNVCEILREHSLCEEILTKLNSLRCRAFLCLQNLIVVMDLEELGGCNDLYNIWLETTKLVFQQTKADEIVLLEAATSLMRAAVQRLAEAKATQFASLSSNDLQIIINGEQQCKDADVRGNLIRIVGSIGQMLVPLNSPLLQVIGKFLLDAAFRDAELWVTAEALDCIFDIFGEDETDKCAYEIGMVDRLKCLLPQLKSKVRMQRKDMGEHQSIIMTANTNLSRFIKYKGKRLSHFSSNGNNHN